MARSYQWFTVRADESGIDDGSTHSVDLLGGGAVAGATVTRVICFLHAAGAVNLSPQFPGSVLAGVQVATAAPAFPFDSPELETTDWLWLGSQLLRAGTNLPTTTVSTSATGWVTGIQTRASRVLGAGEELYISVGLGAVDGTGTWSMYLISRVLCLMPDT